MSASCSDEQCDHTAWLQVHASEPAESAELPKALQELADCDKEDMGCVARKTACSLESLRSLGSCKMFAMENLWR